METNHNPNHHDSSDELEQLAVRELVRRRSLNDNVSVLVVPCGHGDFALQLAAGGAQVTAMDAGKYLREIEQQCPAGTSLCVAEASLTEIPDEPPGAPYDMIFCRRGFCRLTYAAAGQTLRNLLRKLKIGGKLYLSVLGLHSELGDDYPGAEEDITERFCPLSPQMAEKYGIHDPVCLYSERNLFVLALESGGSVLRTFTTTHGNVRAVIVRV